jgi:dTDP-4-amino-4,6-dideoxygalactose transaminase
VSTQRITRIGKLASQTIVIPQTDLKSALSEAEPLWRKNLERVLQRAQFVLGEELTAFEGEFAGATNARFVIGVGSGTDAIEICLRERGIASSDREVLTSPLTAPFTGLAVLSAGASVRFADIDPDTLLLDPASVAQRITSRTAAILPVHLYGQPCPLQKFRQFGIPIIQDACQAHAAKYGGQPLTNYSDWVAYSFYPTKNLGGLGDGGAIATNDPSIAQRIRILRDGGRCGSHVSIVAGINSRLDDLQCCFLRAFLPYLESWNKRRRQLANYYDEMLRDCPGIRLLTRSPESVNHLYVIRAEHRDQFRQHLLDRGITTGIHYPIPLHLQPAFAACAARRGEFPRAEQACAEIISLPLWPNMEPPLVERVAQAVRSFYC